MLLAGGSSGGVPPVEAKATPARQKALGARAKFACQRGAGRSMAEAPGHNTKLAKLFDDMAEAVSAASCGKPDEFRAMQYRKASQAIRGLSFAIEKKSDLQVLRQRLGPRTLAKIEEWMQTGEISKARALKDNPHVQVLSDLCAIWGVGHSTAVHWRSMGLRSIGDVRARVAAEPKLLSHIQALGVQHFEDFQIKIPREEVGAIFERVVREARGVFAEPHLEAQCCGSYRRGRPLCGDVDVLICSGYGAAENKARLSSLVSRLTAQGFITGGSHFNKRFDAAAPDDDGNSATFLGVCRLRGDLPYRRVDIKVWPMTYYAYALLHFTGSGHFNRSMRLFARRMGYTLSDHGLCECRRVRGERVWLGPSVACRSEQEIFSALGLEYVPPTRRELIPKAFEGAPADAAVSVPSDDTDLASLGTSTDKELSGDDQPDAGGDPAQRAPSGARGNPAD